MAKIPISYLFVFYGTPQTQPRPRFAMRKTSSPRKATPRCYDQVSAKKVLDRTVVMAQMHEVGLLNRLEEAIAVEMVFHMGGADKKRTAALNGQYKPTTPDIDNLAKYYLDVMNDLVYKDDRYVTVLSCKKVYSEKKKVEITVTPLGGVLKKDDG